MSRTRLNLFIEHEHAKRLHELATMKGLSKSSIIAAALASFLSPDSGDQREAAIAKRLDRLSRQLDKLEIRSIIIDPQLDADDASSGLIKADPIDPAVPRRAGIEDASAVVAGTAVHIDNLAIVLAARSLSKKLLIVARQTQRRDSGVFRAAPADLVTLSGYVVAAEVLRGVRAPQLATFLRRARDKDEAWAAALLRQIREVIGDAVVESWSIELTPEHAPTVIKTLAQGESVTLRRYSSIRR